MHAVVLGRTEIVNSHTVAEGLLGQVISRMFHDNVHDRTAGQGHVFDSERCCLGVGVFAVGQQLLKASWDCSPAIVFDRF